MTKMLRMLDPYDEIRRLYFTTTAQTIERDLARALDLLTHMATEDERQRVAGYMHGLSDLRREWQQTEKRKASRKAGPSRPGAKKKTTP
jgi:hypothetical protein